MNMHEIFKLINLAEEEMIKSNTHKAKPLYVKAAKMMEDMVVPGTDKYNKNIIFHSAALVYFYAGDYARSAILSSHKVPTDPENRLYYESREMMNLYPKEIINTIAKYEKIGNQCESQKEGCYSNILNLLIEYPYLFPPNIQLRKKIECLIILGRNKEADLFADDLKRLEEEFREIECCL